MTDQLTVESVKLMHSRMDAIEMEMARHPEPEHQTLHHFVPGQYWRTFIMPAGTQWTSKIHRTEHPFIITRGLCSVLNVLTGKWHHYRAPYAGITRPGTRRLLVIHEETAWTTIHENPENETDLQKLEARLIEPHAHSLAIAEKRGQTCLGSQ